MSDPFDTLGVEARFDLAQDALEKRHRELSKALHPDRYATAPAAERRLALGRAIEVNEAFRALRDPVKRAEVLLARRGPTLSETAQPKASPELLFAIMEQREELAEARTKKDTKTITTLAERMKARRAIVMDGLALGFAGAAEDPTKLEEVARSLGELRYINRFLDEVDAIEEELAT